MPQDQEIHDHGLNQDTAEITPAEETERDYDVMGEKEKSRYRSPKGQYKIPTGPGPQLEELYLVRSGVRELPSAGKKLLEECVGPVNFRYFDISNRGIAEDDEVIYSNLFDTKNGIWLLWQMEEARDRTSEDKRFWPSTIFWQSWLRAVKCDDTSESPELKHIVLWSLDSFREKEETWRAEKTSFSREGELLRRGHREFFPGEEGFYLVLGSPMGCCAMEMLIYHRTGLKNPRVEKVIILGDEPDDDSQLSRRAIMVLSRNSTKQQG